MSGCRSSCLQGSSGLHFKLIIFVVHGIALGMVSVLSWGGFPSTLPGPSVDTPGNLSCVLKVFFSYFHCETRSWRNLLLILVLP